VSVFLFGIVNSDVADAVSWSGPIDADSEPDATRLTALINGFAAELGCALEGAGYTDFSTDIPSDSNLYATAKAQIIKRSAAQWILENQRHDDDYTTQAREAWSDYLERARSGQLGTLGADPTPRSNVQGAFNSQSQITIQPSKAPRLGYWRKGKGFN